MKSNKKKIQDSILFFANKYKLSENYKALINISTLPEIVKMIIYEMFLNKFNFYNCTDDEYKHYKLLLEYSEELNKNGCVKFDEIEFKIGDELCFNIYDDIVKGKYLSMLDDNNIKIELTYDSSENSDIGSTCNVHKSFLTK